MRLVRPPFTIVVVMIAATLLAVPDQAWAAASAKPTEPQAAAAQDQLPRVVVARQSTGDDARNLRTDFVEVLRKYPPALGKVLKLDPSRMRSTW